MYALLIFLILLPFFGTTVGSAGVFFMKKASEKIQRSLSGFAAGVMTAACVWSLLMPSIESSAKMGRAAFLPSLCGIFSGVLILIALDMQISRMKIKIEKSDSVFSSDFLMTFLAVTIHNFPEGLAVGMMCAPLLTSSEGNYAPVAAFSLAIALQNIPEGAIISLPLHSRKMTKTKAFLWGTASGAVEPLGAMITLVVTKYVTAALPYLFGFAAGAMLFVVADELIEKRRKEESFPASALSFCFGFSVMMVLDVALG